MEQRSWKYVQKNFSASFFFATQLFSKDIRQHVYTLYAFARTADEIVDTTHNTSDARKLLLEWKDAWRHAYETKISDIPLFQDTAEICAVYDIPFVWTEIFLDALIQDTEKNRYQTYEELRIYMYGVSGIIGLMMTNVIGAKPGAHHYAETLAYAMQLTNILRDVGEDYTKRGRIYIPQEELDMFGITETHIASHINDHAWRTFMQWQIARARRLYREADPGIDMLNADGRKAIRLASMLYEKILDHIEQANYNVFTTRAHTNYLEKLWTYITVQF